MLETAEDDIEEIPHLPGLPSVVRRDEAGANNFLIPHKSLPKDASYVYLLASDY